MVFVIEKILKESSFIKLTRFLGKSQVRLTLCRDLGRADPRPLGTQSLGPFYVQLYDGDGILEPSSNWEPLGLCRSALTIKARLSTAIPSSLSIKSSEKTLQRTIRGPKGILNPVLVNKNCSTNIESSNTKHGQHENVQVR
ncbi:hypothetical protein EVAR_55111_1 [Eumeta japonica]|uniref:Uncharacterized protein n=1 Tax=Eumeta variegata TaxID=151549 RepID=A0A4C1YAF3_EUMVA|nr:hypothetical protein EVAR_55111_1 [Eumeta japonica]